MKRWRTVGLIGVPTDDGRLITGVRLGGAPIPVMRARREGGHRTFISAERVGVVDWRVQHDRIEALLPWRWRHANLNLEPGEISWDADATIISMGSVGISGLTLSGSSAWATLR